MCKKFCCLWYSFIYKDKFYVACGRSCCFEFLFWFSSVILLSKMKLLFFGLWKFAKFLISFLEVQISFCSIFASIFRAVKYNSSVLFTSDIIYFGQKQHIKVQIFGIFECPGQHSSKSSCQFWTGKSVFLQILHHSSVLLCKFVAQKLYILVRRSPLRWKNFETFECTPGKRMWL